ncbi:MAG: hypothetical protein M3537_08665 [Chloroflexota bacterium]|nr:hypothetical protein [Chloroflexota bacterium]
MSHVEQPDRPGQRLCRRGCRQPVRDREEGQEPGLRPELRGQHGSGDRPQHVQGDRHRSHRPPTPPCGAQLGHEDAVGQRHHRQRPRARQPQHRQTRQAGPGRRSVQPVLHPRRLARAGDGRAVASHRRAQPEDDGSGTLAVGALLWREPRRLLRRPDLPGGQLRVQRQASRHRSPGHQGDQGHQPQQHQDCPRHQRPSGHAHGWRQEQPEAGRLSDAAGYSAHSRRHPVPGGRHVA